MVSLTLRFNPHSSEFNQVLFGIKLGLGLQTALKQVTSIFNGIMVPLRNGDQQLNLYYSDPVDIWIDSLPKFAGKTYRKFERQELKQRIRQESKLPISDSPAHRHAQSPIAAFTMLTNRDQASIEVRIPCTMRIATVCNILHKQENLKHNMQHILHTLHIYMDIHI